MEEISTIDIDLATSVFQVHAIDAAGNIIVRRQLRRQQMLKFFEQLPPCLIGMEACGTAHYWARELSALGHDVRLMPPAYVKPYVRRQKNDVADSGDIEGRRRNQYGIEKAVQAASSRFSVAGCGERAAHLLFLARRADDQAEPRCDPRAGNRAR